MGTGQAEVPCGRRGEFGGGGAQSRGAAQRPIILFAEPASGRNIGRDELAAGAAHETALRATARPANRRSRHATRPHPRRRSCTPRISRARWTSLPELASAYCFERGKARRRLIIEIGLARLDQPIEMRASQRELADRTGQRLGDRVMADGAALERGGDIFAPPLQPDLAEHRLGDALAHPCNLVIEGVKREQRLAARGRGKQHRLIPVAVVAAHQRRDRRQAIRFSGTSLRTGVFRLTSFT